MVVCFALWWCVFERWWCLCFGCLFWWLCGLFVGCVWVVWFVVAVGGLKFGGGWCV